MVGGHSLKSEEWNVAWPWRIHGPVVFSRLTQDRGGLVVRYSAELETAFEWPADQRHVRTRSWQALYCLAQEAEKFAAELRAELDKVAKPPIRGGTSPSPEKIADVLARTAAKEDEED